MVSPRSLAIAIAGLSLLPLTSATADDDHRFVITPLLGYRGGGEFDALVGTATPDIDATESYGMALSMNLGQRHALELLYTFQPSEFQDNGLELDIEHLPLGAKATYLESEAMVPYAAAGLGATRFTPDQGDDEISFSGSLALGIEWPINEQFNVRLEGRAHIVYMNGNHTLFCGSSAAGGNCLVRAAGDIFFQPELLLGVGIALGQRTTR